MKRIISLILSIDWMGLLINLVLIGLGLLILSVVFMLVGSLIYCYFHPWAIKYIFGYGFYQIK